MSQSPQEQQQQQHLTASGAGGISEAAATAAATSATPAASNEENANDEGLKSGDTQSGTAPEAAAEGAGPLEATSTAAGPSSSTAAPQPPSGPPTLEDLVALALSCEANHRLISTSLRPAIYRCIKVTRNEAVDVFLQSIGSEQDPLFLLEPGVHSLMMLFVLTARVKSLWSPDALPIVKQMLEAFVAQADVVQLHFAPERVTQLGHAIAHIATILKDATWGLNLLCTLFQRYVGDSRVLTPLHGIVLYQCLKAGAYQIAYQSALMFPVAEVDQYSNPIRYSDVLQYFYYAGLIAAKQNNIADSMDYLEQCVTAPAQGISAIQVDAYKKLLLLQLLHNGKMLPLPDYTSSVLAKGLTTLCRPYIFLAKVFEDRNTSDADLFQKVEEVKDLVQRDQNWSLLQQCLVAYRSRRIQRLASTYSAISLVEVARLLGMSENEESIQIIHNEIGQMILAGWVDATLALEVPATAPAGTPPIPVVRFHSATEGPRDPFTSAPSLATIQARLLEAQRWKLLVEERERAVARSGAFLHKQMQRGGGREGGAGAGLSSSSWGGTEQQGGAQEEDEYEDGRFSSTLFR
ncbi:hypothetical protein V8E36_009351 [Tilletia maclaganii]